MGKLVVLFIGLALAGTTLALTGSPPASASRAVVFGAAQSSYPGATAEQAVTRLQSSIGRSLASIRVYDNFVAAWRAWVAVMRGAGATNAYMVWTVAASNFFVAPTDGRYAPRYYPGDAFVDDIAVDAYNMYCLRTDGVYQQPWRSLQAVLVPLLAFARTHPAPGLLLAEWGSPEDPKIPGRKAAWFADARMPLKQPAYAQFKAILYWNQVSTNFAAGDFRVQTSASSLAAFAAMANDPFYSG